MVLACALPAAALDANPAVLGVVAVEREKAVVLERMRALPAMPAAKRFA